MKIDVVFFLDIGTWPCCGRRHTQRPLVRIAHDAAARGGSPANFADAIIYASTFGPRRNPRLGENWLRLGGEDVADTAHRFDELRLAGVRLDLFPQAHDL